MWMRPERATTAIRRRAKKYYVMFGAPRARYYAWVSDRKFPERND
jgi:hypothetical protein